MTTQSVNLSAEFEEFAAELVKSGRYANTGEVLSAAMDALRREESDDEAKLETLLEAIDEGLASGAYEGDVFADLRTKYGLPPRS
jgi:putative addiction module CopG family antidote